MVPFATRCNVFQPNVLRSSQALPTMESHIVLQKNPTATDLYFAGKAPLQINSAEIQGTTKTPTAFSENKASTLKDQEPSTQYPPLAEMDKYNQLRESQMSLNDKAYRTAKNGAKGVRKLARSLASTLTNRPA